MTALSPAALPGKEYSFLPKAEAVIATAPDIRTHTVDFADRTEYVLAQDRTHIVPASNRTKNT